MDKIIVPGDLSVSSYGEFLVSDLMRLERGFCCLLEEGICCPSATEGSGDRGENWTAILEKSLPIVEAKHGFWLELWLSATTLSSGVRTFGSYRMVWVQNGLRTIIFSEYIVSFSLLRREVSTKGWAQCLHGDGGGDWPGNNAWWQNTFPCTAGVLVKRDKDPD